MIDEDMKKSMTREKITNLLETKRVFCFAIIIIPILVLANTFVFQNPSNYSIYATSARAETSPAPTVAATTPSLTRLNDTELLIVLVNLERIQTQLQLTEKSLADGDEVMAFVHAYARRRGAAGRRPSPQALATPVPRVPGDSGRHIRRSAGSSDRIPAG